MKEIRRKAQTKGRHDSICKGGEGESVKYCPKEENKGEKDLRRLPV